MQPAAYHFDPALRGSKESQNNSFRCGFPVAMKTIVGLSHFCSFFILFYFIALSSVSFPPQECSCGVQTDKNAETAFAEGIGDWSSGIIWAFCQTLLKGHGTVFKRRDKRKFTLRRIFLPLSGLMFKRRDAKVAQRPRGAKPGASASQCFALLLATV